MISLWTFVFILIPTVIPYNQKGNQSVFPKCIVIVVLVSGYVYLLIETLDYHIAITYDIFHIVSQINCELNVNQIPLSI